jgi:hypothetical protein
MPHAYFWRYRYLDSVQRGIQHLTPAHFTAASFVHFIEVDQCLCELGRHFTMLFD